MKDLRITRVIFSSINNQWYLQMDNLCEIETTERSAKQLIDFFNLVEINFNRWEQIK